MRATAESVEASVLSGIDANRVFLVAFGIGTATAALGGVLMGNLQVVSPQLSALGSAGVPGRRDRRAHEHPRLRSSAG